MFGGFDKFSSTCLTPLHGARWRRGLSLAGVFAMATAMSVPAAALQIGQQDPSAAPPPLFEWPAATGTPSPFGSLTWGWLDIVPFGSGGDGALLAQAAGGTIIDGGEGSVQFPRPSDSTPEDGGLPPQVSKPALTTPDLLVTKPRTVPDLDGRFSNGGNEEIW